MNTEIKLPSLPEPAGQIGEYEDEKGDAFDAGQMMDYAHSAVEINKQSIIGEFLERTGQYVTSDANREAAIQAAVEADRRERGEPIELQGVAEALKSGDGFWRECTGCHESNEGYPTGPYSKTLKCHLGVGCAECGGIGAIWDDTDYDAMADYMARDMCAPQPAEPVKVPSDKLVDALAGASYSYSLALENSLQGAYPDEREDIVRRVTDRHKAELRTLLAHHGQPAASAQVEARHPVVVKWRNKGIEACAGIADAYGMTQAATDMRAMITGEKGDGTSSSVVRCPSENSVRGGGGADSGLRSGGLSGVAHVAQPAASAEPVAWPKDAREIRNFIGVNFISMSGGETPDDDDKYLLTAHDLLSAFDWWIDCAAPVAAQTQPSAQAKCQTCGGRGWVGGPSYYTPDEGGEPCPDCAQDREGAGVPDWMTCESRGPLVVSSLRYSAEKMRNDEKRCRGAYKKAFMGVPLHYLADAYSEAATVFETRIRAIDAARAAKGADHD